MNERIKELRNQAGIWASGQLPFTNPEWTELRDEKFAELIVRECAKFAVKAANDAEIKMMDNFIIEFWIKKHFGVE